MKTKLKLLLVPVNVNSEIAEYAFVKDEKWSNNKLHDSTSNEKGGQFNGNRVRLSYVAIDGNIGIVCLSLMLTAFAIKHELQSYAFLRLSHTPVLTLPKSFLAYHTSPEHITTFIQHFV